MRRIVAVPVGVGLTLMAFAVASTTPSDDALQAPFPVTGRIGEAIASQHHVATVHDALLAREVTLDSWDGTTSGVWLVLDATLAARVERSTVAVDLFVDGVRYPGTSRVGNDTLDGRVADAGFPLVGAVLLELPAGILEVPGARSATLRISSDGDTRLDSVVELGLDLTSLEVRDHVDLERPRADTR